MKANIGFGERVFLAEHEWSTYIKRMPVRYIKKKKDGICFVCGNSETQDNLFESSHIIGFRLGIVTLGLTPDFLDKDNNIVTAHKKTCNKTVELDLFDSCKRLRSLGIKDLPTFLPLESLNTWIKSA